MLTVLLLLAACGPSSVKIEDPSVTNPGDSGVVTETPPVPLELTGLSWRLHEEIESLVYVSWTQNVAGAMHVEYSFDADVWHSSPSFEAVEGVNEQILVGIPYETTASWRVVADAPDYAGELMDGEPLLTGDLPNGVPDGELVTYEPDRVLPDSPYLLMSINERNGGWNGGEYWTLILDRQARVVWAHVAPQGNWTLYATVSNTGDYFMWDEATAWSLFDDGERSTIHKTWLDEEIEEIPTPGLHHAFVQLPDGTLAWGSQAHGGGEALVEKAPGADDETIVWTCDDADAGNRCESNCLYYDPDRDSYLYSFYTNSTVYEVERSTGETLWWAGEHDGGYSFDPPESMFSWQHGVTWTDAGTLLLSSEYGSGRDSETWLLEYDVDRTNGTLHNVWGNSSDTYAETNGDAWRFDNGNTLHMVGSASVIREVDLDGEDVWRVDFNGSRLIGRGEFIPDLYALVKPRVSASETP